DLKVERYDDGTVKTVPYGRDLKVERYDDGTVKTVPYGRDLKVERGSGDAIWSRRHIHLYTKTEKNIDEN
ncbi:MAG: hypothetical protein RR415_10615, partial [Ruthenibacterium sp.]